MVDSRSKEQNVDGGPCQNTDRHLWPQVSEPGAPHESLHITKDGALGINCGGYVYVKPIREWHKLAGGPFPAVPDAPVTSKTVADLRYHAPHVTQGGLVMERAADQIEAMAAVGIRQEREIERLQRELRLAESARDYANDLLDRARQRSAVETAGVQVAGDTLPTALWQFEQRASVLLSDEQAKANPDNALIGFICDAVRLARENEKMATGLGAVIEAERRPEEPEAPRPEGTVYTENVECSNCHAITTVQSVSPFRVVSIECKQCGHQTLAKQIDMSTVKASGERCALREMHGDRCILGPGHDGKCRFA